MNRLRNLRVPTATTWADAERMLRVRPPQQYSIVSDCVRGLPGRRAVLEVHPGGHRVINYDQLNRMSAAVAGELQRLGVRTGDRVAVKLSQSIDMAVAVIGIIRARAVVVPISNVLASSGVQYRLNDSRPTVVFCADDDPHMATFESAGITVIGVSALRKIAQDRQLFAPITMVDADEPALLLYTSGTTGRPKGVLHAHRYLLGHHAVDLAFDHVTSDDVAYTPVDWTWAGGLMLGLLVPLAHGMCVIAHRSPRFDPDLAVDLMRRQGVSVGLFPPTVLRMLRSSGALRADHVKGSRMRCFITGAEAVEPELIEWGRSIGVSINNAYGQTEANALVGHAATLEPLDQATMGRPYPGHRVAVLDDDLMPVPTGEPGQLAVHRTDPVCMLSYWDNPGATRDKIRGCWLLTGDTVHRNDDGTLSFHGRNDDIIKSGAYRLGPSEIEAAIMKHPHVTGCAAIGLPDPIRGEVVTAVVTITGETSEDIAHLESELQQLVREHVGAHAYPRKVRVVDQLPTTTTNKVDRAALRADLTASCQDTP